MPANLDLYSLMIVSGDSVNSNQPALQYVNWKRTMRGLAVENPTVRKLMVPAGQSVTAFDNTVPTTIDTNTTFDLTLSPLASDIYRITYIGGTDPTFRTDRGIDLTGNQLTITANTNGTLTIIATVGLPFSPILAGDEIFIPGLMTGDPATVFSSPNQGRWVNLGVTGGGNIITLVRPTGEDFQGFSEVVTPTSPDQFLAYSAAGVQIGNAMDISAGFATNARRTYEVTAVTSKWVEFRSTYPLAEETNIMPTNDGMRFFFGGRRYMRVEVDQESIIRMNGDVDSTLRVSPWVAGDPEQVGELTKTGLLWSLQVENRSSQILNLVVIVVE